MKVYGMHNCIRTMRAREWFKQNAIDFEFHDIRKDGISLEKILEWDRKAGFEQFLNKHVRTWSMLYPKERELAGIRENAIALMHKKLGIIKRPIVETQETVYFGFDENQYRSAFVPRLQLKNDSGSPKPADEH